MAQPKRRLLWLGAAISAAPLALVATAVGVTLWGLRQPDRGADAKTTGAIVIFGARVGAGGKASAALESRTRHAFHLWNTGGRRALLVCTGGGGPQMVTEAQAAAHLLRGWGVPERQILLDNASLSTRENVREAARLLDGYRHALGVSDPYHLWRCRREGGKVGLELAMTSDAGRWRSLPLAARIRMPLREALIVWRDIFYECSAL